MSALGMTDRGCQTSHQNCCESANLAFLDLGFQGRNTVFKSPDVASQALDVTAAALRFRHLVNNKDAAPLPGNNKSAISQLTHGLLNRHWRYAVVASKYPPGLQSLPREQLASKDLLRQIIRNLQVVSARVIRVNGHAISLTVLGSWHELSRTRKSWLHI